MAGASPPSRPSVPMRSALRNAGAVLYASEGSASSTHAEVL